MKTALLIVGVIFAVLFGAIWHEDAQPLLFFIAVAGVGAVLLVIGFFSPLKNVRGW
jgi:uncharacterized membrane protein